MRTRDARGDQGALQLLDAPLQTFGRPRHQPTSDIGNEVCSAIPVTLAEKLFQSRQHYIGIILLNWHWDCCYSR